MPPGHQRTRLTGRAAIAATTLVVALAAVLTNTPPASAHARVQSTAPQNGAVVAREPTSVSFTFDESVESSFGAVRVFDAQSRRVDVGKSFHPGDAGAVIAIALRRGLPQGTYTATYRVISADGHPVSGGIIFSIGKAGAASAESVSQLAGQAGGGPATSTAFAITRALQYGAIAVAIGLFAFLLLVLPRGPTRAAVDDRARRILFWAGVVGAVSGVLAVLLEGAIGGGTSLWAALDWTVVRETLATRFGTVWWLAAIVWVVVAMLGARARQLRLGWLAAPIVLLSLLPAFGGHAATQSPAGVYVVLNVVHVLAISAWFGGLVALLALLPVAAGAVQNSGGGGSPEGTGVPPALAALPRFSRLALLSVAVILITGTAQAVLELTAVSDLWDTAFGRAIVVKVALFAVAGGFATFNHRRSVPALAAGGGGASRGAGDGAASRAANGPPAAASLRSLLLAVRAEVALVVGIFAAAGALGGYPPPTQIPPGPFETTVPIGPYKVTVTVDPARVGPNQIRLMVMRGDAMATDTKQLTVTAVEADRGIGPLSLELTKAAPGDYVASAAVLPVAGHWKLTIVDRVSEFDEYQAFATVPVP